MPNDFGYTNLNYFGSAGVIIESPGEVVTDLYGLETCTSVFKVPRNQFFVIQSGSLAMFSSHYIFTYLHMERRRVLFDKGWFTVTAEYAGIPGANTEPIYELVIGLSEAPVETHPKFVSDIGGKPSAPLNGAIFLDPEGRLTQDDASGAFDRFASTVNLGGGTVRNQFAGITSYLETSESVWRQTYVSTSQPTDLSTVGRISSPEGPAPTLGGSLNWIYFGVTFQRRGICFSVNREWKASGRRGWNPTIYA